MRRHSDDKCRFTPVPLPPRSLSFYRVRELHDQFYFRCIGKSEGRASCSGVRTEHVVDDEKAATEVRSTREVVAQTANRNIPRRSPCKPLTSKLGPGEATGNVQFSVREAKSSASIAFLPDLTSLRCFPFSVTVCGSFILLHLLLSIFFFSSLFSSATTTLYQSRGRATST